MPTKDLIVLVADRNTEMLMRALLGERSPALGIRQPSFDAFRHPQQDSGVPRRAHEFLREFQSQYRFALVMFDLEGSGREDDPGGLAGDVQARLDANGWRDRSCVLVLDPEIEQWIWSPSPHVANELGWQPGELRQTLQNKGLWSRREPKPPRPKEALEWALREKRIPRSSAIYANIAQRVSLRACSDSQFQRLVETLRGWFPR